jgi:hypothetical protein
MVINVPAFAALHKKTGRLHHRWAQPLLASKLQLKQ